MYRVAITKSADKQIANLPAMIQERINMAIQGLKTWKGDISKLSGHKDRYRLRAGKYRVSFVVDHDIIFVIGVDDRKDAYRQRR